MITDLTYDRGLCCWCCKDFYFLFISKYKVGAAFTIDCCPNCPCCYLGCIHVGVTTYAHSITAQRSTEMHFQLVEHNRLLASTSAFTLYFKMTLQTVQDGPEKLNCFWMLSTAVDNRLLGSAGPRHVELSDRLAAKKTDDGYLGKGFHWTMSMLNFIWTKRVC